MKILIVDDDRMVVEVTQMFLKRALREATILTAMSGPEGLDVFEKNRDISVLLTNHHVTPTDSTFTGVVLARKIREIKPEIQVVFMTGNAFDTEITSQMLTLTRSELIVAKGGSPSTLVHAVKFAIDLI